MPVSDKREDKVAGRDGRIKNLLRKGIVVLDGAMGTELQRGGMPTGISPEQWCCENAPVIEAIHGRYRDAGADVIYAATFGANAVKLNQYGISDVGGMNRDLARIARRAAGSAVLVAGDIGPTGRFVRPFGDLEFEDAVAIFREQAAGLAEGGVDLFVIETMMDIQEARAALIAVKEVSEKFAIVTMTYEKHGRTLNGTDPLSALITLQSLGADAVGCNCSTGPEEMIACIRAMKPFATVPLVAKPNAGLPELVNGESLFTMSPAEFGSFGERYAEAGVNLMGGCCGTGPDHIRVLKQVLTGYAPIMPRRKSLRALSSARGSLLLDDESPLVIAGERINPTGKKVLQEELRNGTMTLVQQMAREQESRGAALLDVNAGMPGIDEQDTMERMLAELSVSTALPLVIDSSNIETIERALRLYPGRALINSISGEREKVEKLLPLAARYGAMFILLPLTGRGVPKTAVERQEIIRDVFSKARAWGFTKDDILVDGLVMTVSSDSGAPRETLKTVEWCSRVFKSATVVGLSNVSFGLPERKWINAAFLAMLADRGLTMAIANPENDEVMNLAAASALLSGRDREAERYLRRFAGADTGKAKKREEETLSPAELVCRVILEGNRGGIESAVSEALQAGTAATNLVNQRMIPAITDVGERYDRGEYFLPQLIASAEAMKRGMDVLDPFLKETQGTQKKKGRILMATVKGDIHDIGKNIVVLMLSNHGFDVVDLGKDVPADTIAAEARRLEPDIIGLSALMTTTMVNMKDVVECVKRQGLGCEFLVGGAVINESFARSIGAHYAKDGVAAVRVAERLVRS